MLCYFKIIAILFAPVLYLMLTSEGGYMTNLISTSMNSEIRPNTLPSCQESISLSDGLLTSMNVLSILKNGEVIGIHNKAHCVLSVDTRYRVLRDRAENVVNMIDKIFKNCLLLSVHKLNLPEEIKWNVIFLESFYDKALVGLETLRRTYTTPEETDSEAERLLACTLNTHFFALKGLLGWSYKNIDELYRKVKDEVVYQIPNAPPYVEESEKEESSLASLAENSKEHSGQLDLALAVKKNRYSCSEGFSVTLEELQKIVLKPGLPTHPAVPIHRSGESDDIASLRFASSQLTNGSKQTNRLVQDSLDISERVRLILKSSQFRSLRTQREGVDESTCTSIKNTPGLNSLAVSEWAGRS